MWSDHNLVQVPAAKVNSPFGAFFHDVKVAKNTNLLVIEYSNTRETKQKSTQKKCENATRI